MRLRFGFDFDEAGRASGLVSSAGGAASPLSVHFSNSGDGGIATSYAGLGTAAMAFGLSSLSGGSAPSAPSLVSSPSAPTSAPESITGANSPGGGGGSMFEDIGGYGASSGGDGVNDSSGPGKTARISQYYDSGDARYEFSGNQDIDATLIGSKWTITNLTFSFPTSGSFYQTPYYDSGHLSGQFAFNAQMQNAVRYALGLVAGYTNLTFTEVTESNSTHGNLRYSQTTDASLGSAEGNFPGSDTWDGDIWFGNTNQPFYQTPNIGNWGQATIMHETGHTMGLKHGHQDYTSQDLTGPGYVDGPGPRYGSAALPANHDGQAWSLMTYRSDPGNSTQFEGDQFNQPQTYMQDDIAALQYLYGANFTYNSGNTTYTFSSTTGEMFVNGVSQGDPDGNKVFRTIWDGNGVDTYDLHNFSGNQSIDLRPGNWTTFNSAQLANNRAYSGGTNLAPGNIANALLYNGDARSLIENAIGGSGNDSMYGNDAGNNMTGGAGNDYMYGIAGNDTNYGGAGDDTLDESLGSNGGNDFQFGEGGNDSVYGGYGDDYVDGGANDDRLVGNDGNDVLYGGTGHDTMQGGAGNDSYYVDSVLDVVTENVGEGTDLIYTNVTLTIAANVENLTMYNGYTINATGNALDNVINGNDNANVIDSRSGGTDTVNAYGGDDVIYSSGYGAYYGGTGNDTIYAGLGLPETLDGGADTDTLDTTSFSSSYVINLTTGLTDWAGESFVNFENLISGAGNDSITGTSGDNIINSGAGNDTVDSGNGTDTVNGADGNDRIYTTTFASHTYNGGNGDDFIGGGFQYGNTWDGGAGTDTVDVTLHNFAATINLTVGTYTTVNGTLNIVNFENVNAGDHDDSITGTAGANLINANGGNDTIDSGGGIDTVNGGDGNDRIYTASFASHTYNGGNGDDFIGGGFQYGNTWDGGADIDTVDVTLHNFAATIDLTAGTYTTANGTLNIVNFENANAGDKNDIITGTSSANIINGNGGNDSIAGGAGDDTLTGGLGNDTISAGAFSDGNDSVDGGDGNDVLTSSGWGTTLGGVGDDYIYAGIGANETLDGGSDVDTLDTTLFSGAYLVNLATGLTNYGGESFVNFENLISGAGNDTLIGTSGANTITGGNGNDRIDGAAGADTMIGGLGDDSFTFDNTGDIATESNGQGTDTIVSTVDVTLTSAMSIEVVTLSGAANLSATGNSFANTLNGNTGNNALSGGLGADTMAGGLGNDTYTVENAGDVINENVGEGTDTVKSYLTYTMAANVENLQMGGSANIDATGNALDNVIKGNAGNNVLSGGGGTDLMYGLAGDDTYYIDTTNSRAYEILSGVDTGGIDTVYSSVNITLGIYVENLFLTGAANLNGIGNDGDNQLTGNSGINYLTGAGGNDTMTGGLERDVFAFAASSGDDLITDFSKPQNDKINVNALSHGTVFGAGITITQSAGDVVIDLGGGNTVTITSALVADVTSHMIW